MLSKRELVVLDCVSKDQATTFCFYANENHTLNSGITFTILDNWILHLYQSEKSCTFIDAVHFVNPFIMSVALDI